MVDKNAPHFEKGQISGIKVFLIIDICYIICYTIYRNK